MKQFQFLFLAISLVYFSACGDTDPSEFTGTADDVLAMLQEDSPVQEFTVSNAGFDIITDNNTLISVAPRTFVNADGSPYNGSFVLSVIELQTKSDIMRYGYQTLTVDGEILTSDGEFRFEAVAADTTELVLAEGAFLDIRIPNEAPSSEAILFELSGEQLWTPLEFDGQSVGISEWEVGENEWSFGYDTRFPTLDWVNVDYFTKFDEPLTDISLCLPRGYGLDNTMVFIVFSDRDIVLSPTMDGTAFTAPLPIGENVHVVAITAEGEDRFRIAKEEVVIVDNLKVDLEPDSASKEEIIECLENLD
jgi:hypothetical protein